MRFDPQAGFTPTDSPDASAPQSAPPVAGKSGAKVFAALLVVGGVGFAVWQFGMPIFAPAMLNAQDTAASENASSSYGDVWEDDIMNAIESFTGRSSSADAIDATQSWLGDEDSMAIDVVAAEADAAWLDEERAAREAFERAERLMATGKYAQATELLTGVLEHSPDDAQAIYKLGLAYVMQRDMVRAREQLARLRTLNPSLASLLGNLVPRS